MFDLHKYVAEYVCEVIGEDEIKEAAEEIIDGIDFRDVLRESDKLREAVYEAAYRGVDDALDMYV